MIRIIVRVSVGVRTCIQRSFDVAQLTTCAQMAEPTGQLGLVRVRHTARVNDEQPCKRHVFTSVSV